MLRNGIFHMFSPDAAVLSSNISRKFLWQSNPSKNSHCH